jgi:hypothetical protein
MPWTIAQARRETDRHFFPDRDLDRLMREHFTIGATMTRARASLPAPLLALLPILALVIGACDTQRKPLTGFEKQPPGTILLSWETGSRLMVWPIFALPFEPHRIFRPRLNGQYTVSTTSQEGFFDYTELWMQGWTGSLNQWIQGVPAGTYVVELVDSSGQSWGESPPITVPAGASFLDTSNQVPGVVIARYDGHAGSWAIDPATQDEDPSTVEITVTNLVNQEVIVERCRATAAGRSSCTTVGTVAPQADLLTVETMGPSTDEYPALFIHLPSDGSQSYQRDLILDTGTAPLRCQVERILVHGPVPSSGDRAGTSMFAMSSCYGYGSGPGSIPL